MTIMMMVISVISFKMQEANIPVALKAGKLSEDFANDELIFHNLVDYNMGVPDTPSQFDKYIAALKAAYKKLHRAGIVHFDGYPSNIMWKAGDNDTMEIKLIDFDCAVWLGKPLPAKIRDKLLLEKYQNKHYYWTDTDMGTQQHDAWFVYMFLKMNDQEKSESFSNRRIVDKVIEVYWKTVRRVFQNNADICAEFNVWFSTEWDIATADAR